MCGKIIYNNDHKRFEGDQRCRMVEAEIPSTGSKVWKHKKNINRVTKMDSRLRKRLKGVSSAKAR